MPKPLRKIQEGLEGRKKAWALAKAQKSGKDHFTKPPGSNRKSNPRH